MVLTVQFQAQAQIMAQVAVAAEAQRRAFRGRLVQLVVHRQVLAKSRRAAMRRQTEAVAVAAAVKMLL